MDRLQPLLRIGARQQCLHGNIDEARIAIVVLAVGEAQVHDLGQQMDVPLRIVPERLQVDFVQQREHLQQHRPLAPGTAAQHVGALEREAQRLLDLGVVFGEILRRHQPTVLAMILRDRLGDVAAIEGVARRRQACVATVHRRRFFLVGHELDRAAEIGLHQPVAFTQRRAVAMIDRGVLRPASIVLDLVLQEGRHDGMDREAVARIADGRRRDLAEAHGAVALQRQDPGVGRRRNHGAQEAHGDRAVVVTDELLDVERLRPPAEAGDRHRLVAVGQVDQHRRDTGELDLVAVHDPERDAAGNAGVDRVAARPQDRMRRLGSEILAGRRHIVVADDHWLHPHHALPRTVTRDPTARRGQACGNDRDSELRIRSMKDLLTTDFRNAPYWWDAAPLTEHLRARSLLPTTWPSSDRAIPACARP